MVLSRELMRAARGGDKAVVAAWLESGGGNDVEEVDGKERTLLLGAAWGRGPSVGSFDERNVALARYLLDHGADVNRSSRSGYTSLHWAAFCRSESSPPMVALLLKAGANVLATNDKRNNPLTIVLRQLGKAGPSRPRMVIALLLLRALPSLDHAHSAPIVDDTILTSSAEQVLDWAVNRLDGPLPPDNCFEALRAVVVGVRAAGGWRAYDREPRAEVLRLRSLALRRRAVLPSALPQRFACGDRVVTRPKTAKAYLGTVIAANSIQIVVKLDDAKGFEAYPPEGGEDLLLRASYIRSLEFLVRCPPEIAWHILGYWRCQYPVETVMIDQLGYH